MKKPPGVFSLMASVLTGFGAHLVSMCITARDRLVGLPRKARPGKRYGRRP
jgi:hypothetical protein